MCFAVAAEGSDVVFTGGNGSEIIAWNYKSQTELWRKQVHSGKVLVTALAVCGDLVISGSHDRTVRCVEASTGEEKWVSEEHSAGVTTLAVCGDLVISGSADKTVRCVEASTGEEK